MANADPRDGQTTGKRARSLLHDTDTCTLATASPDGVPEAATIRFVADDQFNIYLNSSTTYRKYENMSANPRVAVVVDGNSGNLQLEGVATELQGSEEESVVSKYVTKYGHSDYLTHEDSTRFKIETDWVRLLVDGRFPPDHEMIVGEGETELH